MQHVCLISQACHVLWQVVLADGLLCGFNSFAVNSPALRGVQQLLMHHIDTQTTKLAHMLSELVIDSAWSCCDRSGAGRGDI